ncbi:MULTISPECIES: hypothetical protein [unclassified Haladaptatus]|uniref:hypothetical protein n=1 Tax=unclassified Haladaptatus TaxID=2622732 RepID=UPI00209C20A4|nr:MULTISPECIES: hypothetical protein [unclassified Haladaptatus]MCO8242456.1 hypothetical protein [Haladaptatus sp. AB643]MCO8252213.1 hypothetical protein [Haladaptatus sp. AB618]
MDGGIESHDSDGSATVPDWDDEYVDRVSDRLFVNYDLEKAYSVRGEPFTLYGRLLIETQKQFLHRSINYANHSAEEHLFVRRAESVRVRDLESIVDFGHELADEWIDPDEEHFGTNFTFVVIAPEIPDDVDDFVADFSDRTLLKYGLHGQYEINLAVVAPDHETLVASKNADVGKAFALWQPLVPKKSGLLSRFVRRFKP